MSSKGIGTLIIVCLGMSMIALTIQELSREKTIRQEIEGYRAVKATEKTCTDCHSECGYKESRE